jgi:precorrin-6B methylase 2
MKSKIKRILVQRGFLALLAEGYEKKIRPILPSKSSDAQLLNGVHVEREDSKMLDSTVGRPNWEAGSVIMVRSYVSSGDTVVEIGSGVGVTTVYIAQEVGEGGKVYAYDPSETMISLLETTLDRNEVPACVSVYHASVGSAIEVSYHEGKDAEVVDPTSIPACDVLVIDAEGAELEILQKLSIRPRVILVETHANYGSPASKVIEIARKNGYEMRDSIGNHDMIANLAFRRV